MLIDVDLDLVRKYDRPGPRYTSYPTAPHFSDAFSLGDWETHINTSNETAARPLSLYFHIPFCNRLCWFCACSMIVSRSSEPMKKYLATLHREVKLYASRMNPNRKVVQIHFGGGTPTHMTPDQIREVGTMIHDTFQVAEDAEISIEMDPRGLTEEHILALRDVGFNRASVGIQDFDPKVQKAINRVHDAELVGRVLDWIRTAGFNSLNLDLIYGLPHQTIASFEDTLEQIIAFEPDRLAVFSYAHVPWIKTHQKLILPQDMPAPEEKLRILKYIIETLTTRGYDYIGMDHFAKSEDELAVAQREGSLQRNFQGYSTWAGTDIQAFGMSSISQLPRAYAQHTKNLELWHSAVDAGRLPLERGVALSEEDAERRHIIMRLMCDMGMNYAQLSEDLGYDVRDRFRTEFESLDTFEEDGLLSRSESGIEITSVGRLFIRNIAMTFDAYLEQGQERFSQTV